MDDVLVVFSSSTTAGRVKLLLKKSYGIDASLEQTPAGLSLNGCSFCLRTNAKYADIIWKIIKQNSLSSKGIFRSSDFYKIR